MGLLLKLSVNLQRASVALKAKVFNRRQNTTLLLLKSEYQILANLNEPYLESVDIVVFIFPNSYNVVSLSILPILCLLLFPQISTLI